ncbi:hypothetical protein PIB30_026773 [Stylosanthes scabra]|uniref:Uncharacterized protein n=1 Tax=Stylosanthes scabra TaxID=79078 RepID=A0ABU6XA56_9FABA|nr:hypothetical protein [Stylosanthes scabra]
MVPSMVTTARGKPRRRRYWWCRSSPSFIHGFHYPKLNGVVEAFSATACAATLPSPFPELTVGAVPTLSNHDHYTHRDAVLCCCCPCSGFIVVADFCATWGC